MTAWTSRLYAGVVVHTRLRPRRHRLRYRIFQMLLDLDELDALNARLRLFSVDRFNLLSFYSRDYGDGSSTPLKVQVERRLAEAGIEGGGPIRLLAMPRVLGHAFNPLSLYFCHDRRGALSAILYEVNNTFGQRYRYLAPVAVDAGPVVRQTCDKRFYVSPFMDMDLTYRFTVEPPGENVRIRIDTADAEGDLLIAAFAGESRTISDAALLQAWLRHPLLSLKVIGGIHWEALRIWLKGVALRPRPPAPAPAADMTMGRADDAARAGR